jgi:hypothetical protein
MTVQTENAIASLVRYGMQNFIMPAMETAYNGYRDMGFWLEAQATAHFNARIGAVAKNAFWGLPATLALFVLPPWLVYGGITVFTVIRVCTDWYDENGIKTFAEPVIGMYFLASAIAHISMSILQGGNSWLALSAACFAFLGITYLPIHE